MIKSNLHFNGKLKSEQTNSLFLIFASVLFLAYMMELTSISVPTTNSKFVHNNLVKYPDPIPTSRAILPL